MANITLVGYLEDTYLTEPYMSGINGETTGMQVEFKLPNEDLGGMQTEFSIIDQSQLGMQAKIFPLAHALHPKYLADSEGYLEEAYLAEKMCAFQGMQAQLKIDSPDDDFSQGMQVDLAIEDQFLQGMQTEMVVQTETSQGMQTEFIKTFKLGSQANYVIYNTTQLRILCDFDSRGLSAEYAGVPSADDANWKTLQTMAGGDLGKLKHLNNDKVEQRVQTADSVISLWDLRCDTGQSNTFVDTIGILNHNFTSSAIVQFQGSDDSNFGTIKFQETLTVEAENIYFIAPTLPTVSARYFRFLIQDPTNPDNHLRIGTIVFGSARILTPKERFINPVRFGKVHFKDSQRTEGFSSNSNDRATRKKLTLVFEKLDIDGGNFELIGDYTDEAKTDLKCLIIPTPLRPSALAVFSKLVQLPDEDHFYNDDDGTNWKIDLTLDWDESL